MNFSNGDELYTTPLWYNARIKLQKINGQITQSVHLSTKTDAMKSQRFERRY